MKLTVMQALIALRFENWAVDQEIAGFHPKISRKMLAWRLNKSNAVKELLRKVGYF